MGRIWVTALVCSVGIWAAALSSPLLIAQREAPAKAGRPTKTVWGHPDLEGVWDFSSNTPFQRPVELGTRAEYTDAEVAEQLQKAVQRRVQQDAGVISQDYNRAWTDDARVNKQTSLLIDPPNGRLPAHTAAAQKWYQELDVARKGVDLDAPTPGGFVEDLGYRGLFARCIVGFNAGPPILPQSYNQNVQIFQGPNHVGLLHEMVHNARVVSLDGRPHVSPRITGYNGDSRGRWAGDTLVVETTNFGRDVYDPYRTGGGMRPNISGAFKLTERFTRVADDTLIYEWTIEDPSWYAAPVTARIPMVRNPLPMYEYACHEGNYGMTGILEGARRLEAQAAKESAR